MAFSRSHESNGLITGPAWRIGALYCCSFVQGDLGGDSNEATAFACRHINRPCEHNDERVSRSGLGFGAPQ